MKSVSNNYKNSLKINGRQIDAKITFGNTNLGKDDINSLIISTNGGLLKSIMTQIELDSNVNIPEKTNFNAQFGVLVNGEYEYINYYNFIVKTSEYNADTLSYKVIAYDYMLDSMVKYDDEPLQDVEYPITVKDYLELICDKFNWTLATNEFANDDTEIAEERFAGIGYTYRDILDDIAEITGSIICFRQNQLNLIYPTETNFVLDEEYLKDTNVTIKEKYGAINVIYFTRSADSDSIYYPATLPENPIEITIRDNQFLIDNNRNVFFPELYDKLNGLEFYLYEFDTFGVTFLEVGDIYTIQIGNNTYSTIVLNSELNITQGLEEKLYVDLPKDTEKDYSVATSEDKRTSLIVDKVNNQINAVVATQNDLEGRLNQAELNITDQSATISIISTNIDKDTGDIQAVKTINGYTFDSNGLNIATNQNEYNTLLTNEGTYYRDGETIVSQTTREGTITKDLALYGKYYYGIDEDISIENFTSDDAMFVAQKYTDANNEECVGHFYNGV